MTQFLYNIRNEIIVLAAIAMLLLPGATLAIYSLSNANPQPVAVSHPSSH